MQTAAVHPREPSLLTGKPNRSGWSFRLVAMSAAALIGVGLLLFTVGLEVNGPSMEPSLQSGDHLLAIRTIAPFTHLRRSDLVVFTRKGEAVDYIKRIVGLPGETVQIRDGRVWINGQALTEPYARGATLSDFAEIQLGTKEFFLLGDHRIISRDSRNLGPISRENIRGKAFLVCWPWSHRSLLAPP